MVHNVGPCVCPVCSSEDVFNSAPSSSPSPISTEPNDDMGRLEATPLPWFQLFIVIFIQVAEPVTSSVIYPFVNDLVRSLGITNGDERKTGYYVGLIESFFYVAEALTVLNWGRASDRLGRRPILLGGMLGLTVAMLGFGLSKRYWMLILSRCAQGVFNGNIGVTKSVIAEITDVTNAAQAFSFLPVAWSTGSTLGPLIGGTFTAPAARWPNSLGRIKFLRNYPYFLPCLVATFVPLTAFLLAFAGLKETLPSKVTEQRTIDTLKARITEIRGAAHPKITSSLLSSSSSGTCSRDYGATTPAASLSTSTALSTPIKTNSPLASSDLTTPPSFSSLLVSRVLVPISNFAFLAFLDQSLLVLLPLIYSTPMSLGGLGLPPSTIGSILGVWGVINGIIQVFCFARVRKFVGHRTCYRLGIAGLGVCFALFPFLAVLVEWDGGRIGVWVWIGIMLQLSAYTLSYMSYGTCCMFMYIAAAAPSRSSLGATNALAQLTASSVRALAPSTASSLYSFSLQLGAGSWYGIGYYLVYITLCTIATVSLWWSTRLPKDLEGDDREHRRQLST